MEQKLSDHISLFNDAERRYPVNQWQIGGLHIWPILRICLGANLGIRALRKHSSIGEPRKKGISNRLRNFSAELLTWWQYLRLILFDRKMESALKPCSLLFFIQSVEREKVDGKYYGRLSEPFAEELEKHGVSSITLEHFNNFSEARFPRSTASHLIFPYFFGSKWLASFVWRWQSKDNNRLDRFEEFCREFSFKCGLDVPSVSQLSKTVSSIRILSWFFEKLLRKLKCSATVSTEYYSTQGFALALASRRLGILCYDFQHGYARVGHYAYEKWANQPPSGYNLMPHGFLVWGKDDAKHMEGWSDSTNSKHIYVIENYRLRNWKTGTDKAVLENDRLLASLNIPASFTRHVLLTLDLQIPSSWVLSTLKASHETTFWWIRMHPCHRNILKDLEVALQNVGVANWNINEATSFPLYTLFRKVDIHLTNVSSVTKEACQFGIPTILLSEVGEEIYRESIERGAAFPARSQEDILRLFSKLSVQKSLPIVSSDKKGFYDFLNCLKLQTKFPENF